MKLTKLPPRDGVIRFAVEGNITQEKLYQNTVTLEEVLGVIGYDAPVLLNLEQTGFIDSSGISWLIIQHKHFMQARGTLVLHSVPPMVDQVLRLMRLHYVLNISANEDAAVVKAKELKA